MVFVLREHSLQFVIVSLQFTFYSRNKTRVLHVHFSFSQMSVVYGGELKLFLLQQIYLHNQK